MGSFELFSKSVARKFFNAKPSTKLTAADIRRGGWENGIGKIVEEYQEADFDLRLLELHNETVDDLLKFFRPLCREKSPVVFIDYLQIIPSTMTATSNIIPRMTILSRAKKKILKKFLRIIEIPDNFKKESAKFFL